MSKYRVWYIPQVPMQPFLYETGDFDIARAVLNALGGFSYYEFKNNIKPDYADAGGIELWDDEYGWEEFTDYDD